MGLIFAIGVHAGYNTWPLRRRLIALAMLALLTVIGAAYYEFYDVNYFLAGVWRRFIPALILATSGYYLGRFIKARRHRARPYAG